MDEFEEPLKALPARTLNVLRGLNLTTVLALKRAVIIGAVYPGYTPGIGEKPYEQIKEIVGVKINRFMRWCPNCFYSWGSDPEDILRLIFSDRCTTCRRFTRKHPERGSVCDYCEPDYSI